MSSDKYVKHTITDVKLKLAQNDQHLQTKCMPLTDFQPKELFLFLTLMDEG